MQRAGPRTNPTTSEVSGVDSVVMDWLRIGLSAAAVILLLKLIFLRVNVPGLSAAVAAI